MAYDRNGTSAFYHDGTHPSVQVPANSLVTLNDESDQNDLVIPITGGGWSLTNGFYLAFIFPQLRDLVGWGGRFGTAGTYVLQSSPNSTDGMNGTWTNLTTAINNTAFDPANPLNRTTYSTGGAPGLGAVRFFVTGLNTGSGPAGYTAYGVHLYGGVTTGQNLDRLSFTDLFTNPLAGSALDEGDIVQSSSGDKQLQVTNASPTRTAQSISVFTEVNTDTVPSVAAQYLVSTDGVNFSATVVVASLSPGQSQEITLRRVTPSNAATGGFTPRLVARAGSWQ
jgi:hypothetical protein